ncbi:M3 family peptidase [Emticicia sp. CRIBPO]|uniref:M3 family metallopeptidase n=1 Tax=Emticicia sp. CRIBPO TaxID=2683258 RepID=UPI001413679D|nr:M3 family metallopeptidase [Emticicia sp. CRIBPO]NBA87679.1 M3 family peptidase [Emticicia sp. CRIBPO]
MSDNPLLNSFDTLHQTAPYDKIKPEHFIPAIKMAIEEGKKEIETIVNNTDQPDFENTILALEHSGQLLNKVSHILFHLNGAETSPEIQNNVREASPLLTEFSNDISLNPELFKRVKAVWEQMDHLKLDQESKMLLDNTYKGFARNGANLDEKDKERFREINKELSQLSISFSENVLHETNEYALHITQESDLTGLPDFAKEAAKATAASQQKEGWIITLQAPSYLPFMQYAENRELRKELFMAFNSRGYLGNKNDNQENVYQIVKLRYEKARLLGYKTWADYILEERMADSVKIVEDFLADIRQYAEPAAAKELDELTIYARNNGFQDEKLQRWDVSYYSEKLKKEKFAINDELLKPYFKLENVLEGIFTLADKLYGITFKENPDIAGWHDEVKAFEVFDENGELLSVWYGDYFPRTGKRAGAWNNTIQSQWIENGVEFRPHVVNVCNFSRPTETKPSLLTFNEVTTLFHEFGHALHAMLAKGKYSSLSGTSVAWDFVELPSQIMENFAAEPEVLKLFARHYETGELIPDEYIRKIKDSSNFMAGLGNIRQLGLGTIDMKWHSKAPDNESIEEFEAKNDTGAAVYPKVEGISVSTAFSHIFSGGYSAGYYSYKWSEVLDADAFELFKEKGIFNKEVAESFRDNILSKGGSEKPMELYRKFRGRAPKAEAMFKRSGLLENN